MDSSFWFDTIKLGMVHCSYWGVTGYNFLIKIVFLSMKILFVLAKSMDPDMKWHFIWVFTVCQSKHLGIISIQSDKG